MLFIVCLIIYCVLNFARINRKFIEKWFTLDSCYDAYVMISSSLQIGSRAPLAMKN